MNTNDMVALCRTMGASIHFSQSSKDPNAVTVHDVVFSGFKDIKILVQEAFDWYKENFNND